jgi:AAA domain
MPPSIWNARRGFAVRGCSMNAQQLARIPAELRARDQWLLARPDVKGALKVPSTIRDGVLYPGSSIDRSTWLSFDIAMGWALHLGLGLGYCLAADDPFACIDCDVKGPHNETDQTKWTPQDRIDGFWQLAEKADSFVEWSQSGKGLHIWVEAAPEDGAKHDGVEVYTRDRFIVCTGNVAIDKLIANRQPLVNQVVLWIRTHQGAKHQAKTLVEIDPVEPDSAIWRRASGAANGAKFIALCEGDWAAMGYPSQSEADMALLSTFTLHSPSNEQCRRMFLETELGKRDKATKDDRYLDLTLKRLRGAQAEEAARVRALKASLALPTDPPPPGPEVPMIWINGDYWPANTPQLPQDALVMRTADTIIMKVIDWLWPGFIACSFLNLVVGETAAGKSTVLADVTARTTTGRPWPGEDLNTPLRQPGRVLWLGSEDPMEILTVPRLRACGAELSRITEIQGVTRLGQRNTFSMQDDLAMVRAEIAKGLQAGAPYAMLVIDPITSYLHGGKLRKVDMNDSGQLRTVLEPWLRLAQETGIAVVGVTHLAKDTTRTLLHRVLGGGAFAQLCRSLLAVVNLPEEGQFEKAVLQVKSNLPGVKQGAWRFHTAQKVVGQDQHKRSIEANFPVWDHIDTSISAESLAGGKRGPMSTQEGVFRTWLRSFFAPDQSVFKRVDEVRLAALTDCKVSESWWHEHNRKFLAKENQGGIWMCRPQIAI